MRKNIISTISLICAMIACQAEAQVVIDFDLLPDDTVVESQFPQATFSSEPGFENRTRIGDFGSSFPNFICTAPIGAPVTCRNATFVDFDLPVYDLSFLALGVNGHGKVAEVNVYEDHLLSGTVDILGPGGEFTPVLVGLEDFSSVSRIEIVNITDSAGIGWDDFIFMVPVTVVRSTVYERTFWEETDLVDGTPRVFFGVPVPSMLGADSAAVFLEDAILAPGSSVTIGMQQILLDLESELPADVGGVLYDLSITLDPDPLNPSLGTMTLVWGGTNGPGPVGTFTREQAVNLIVSFTPTSGGLPIPPVKTSVIVTTPLPIPFTFTPESTVVLSPGLAGDTTANIHTDLQPDERNFFTLPSLGAGVVMQPPAFQTRESVRGGGKALVTQPISGDECPLDPFKNEPGLTGCGNSDADSDGNSVPDFYDFFITEDPDLVFVDGFEFGDTSQWSSTIP